MTKARKSARAQRTDELAPPPPSRFVLPRTHLDVLESAQRERALEFVRALLSAPTAPYFEDLELAVIRRFVDERPGLKLVADRHANLIVEWSGTDAAQSDEPVLAFSAHLDHPAFHFEGTRAGVARASFHGGVPTASLRGAPVRFHVPRVRDDARTACATAVVADVARDEQGRVTCTLKDVRGKLARGSFGVFDLTDGVLRGSRLSARVCDDLMGAAAILSLLDELARTRHPRRVLGIFTRAEETGFIGCLGLLQEHLLASNVRVIGLECSPKRVTARVGRGVVIRVGDRQSVFDPELSLELQSAVGAVRARAPKLRVQRALMDGGSCESTAYNLHGVRSGAMCLALGNYHNVGPKGVIAPEFVDWNDFEGLIAVMIETARRFGGTTARDEARARLQRGWSREYKLLEHSARRIRDEPTFPRTRSGR